MKVQYREKSYRKFGQQWYEVIIHSEGAESHMRVPMILNGELTREFPIKVRSRKVSFVCEKEEDKVSVQEVSEIEKPKRKKKNGKKLSGSAFRKLLSKNK